MQRESVRSCCRAIEGAEKAMEALFCKARLRQASQPDAGHWHRCTGDAHMDSFHCRSVGFLGDALCLWKVGVPFSDLGVERHPEGAELYKGTAPSLVPKGLALSVSADGRVPCERPCTLSLRRPQAM